MNIRKLLWAAFGAAFFMVGAAYAQNPGAVTNHAYLIGKGAGNTGYTSLLCGSAQLAVGQSAADPICRTLTGDVTLTAAGVTAIGAGKVTAAMHAALTSAELRGILSDEVGTGAAYFIGGALGTPASATLTNATGLPLAGLTNQSAYTILGNFSGSTGAVTASKISALTDRAGFGPGDKLMIEESTGEIRKVDYNDFPGAGSLGGATGSTDNAALRADGTGGATVQSSALIIDDTTGRLSRSGNGGIPIQGTNTNDSASAGDKGEYTTASNNFGSVTASTPANAVSISLTAGDWDVSGYAYFTPGGSTNVVGLQASLSTTSATVNETDGFYAGVNYTATTGLALSSFIGPTSVIVPGARFSLSGTTTVYLVIEASFTSTMTATGFIRARRAR